MILPDIPQRILIFLQVQWMGFDDKLHYYWGGSGGKRGYCACGINRTCSNPQMNCNCDSERFVQNLEDRGYLTIKEHLPVRRIDYLDVRSDTGKVGISTIGPLQCSGTGEIRKPRTQFSKMNQISSGYFLTSLSLYLVFCSSLFANS